MQISEIMTKSVATVKMDDFVRYVKAQFEEREFHHLLVVDQGIIQGVISDRDLFKILSPFCDTPCEQRRDTEILNKRAHQIMSRNPVTVLPETSIKEAFMVLTEQQISCLPVTNESGKVLGIVSWKDLLRAAFNVLDTSCWDESGQ
ncbi:MAG: CBS domain-containing protein [Thermodesulfobacteriota bacterium]